MSFIIYDLAFLALFAAFVFIFLYTHKRNLKKEGLLFLYKTSWGIKLIDYLGKKYKRTLKVLSYVSIFMGYLLMVGVVYLVYAVLKVYLFRPDITTTIKIPPIMPLIPYLPKIFNLNFLPEFNFTYWIVILAIIAISHEMAHGIFASYNNVKIKKTGFGFFPFFLPVFLAAFVELDEKIMEKKGKFAQMSILSAGTFANVICAVLFFGIMWLFFSLAFVPSGVVFDTYSYSFVNVHDVTRINGVALENPNYEDTLKYITGNDIVMVGSLTYEKGVVGFMEDRGEYYIGLYDNAPAINAQISGAIIEINGVDINNREVLADELEKYSPGDAITITTFDGTNDLDYDIILGEHPEKEGTPWLGIGFIDRKSAGISGKLSNLLSVFKNPNVYYESNMGEGGIFIYNLLWWLVLISISVALVNMLPVGIFDGGRFFYLTILAITGSETKARKSFKFVTYLFLLLLAVLMILWVANFF